MDMVTPDTDTDTDTDSDAVTSDDGPAETPPNREPIKRAQDAPVTAAQQTLVLTAGDERRSEPVTGSAREPTARDTGLPSGPAVPVFRRREPSRT
jgi:hypothetical protein